MALFSIGHSNVSIDGFIELLQRHEIELLADTRSKPFSRYNPHFSREPLKRSLNEEGIEYVFLGRQLGGKPEDEAFYFQSGKVDYQRLAETPFYQDALRRLLELSDRQRVAFMCAEADYKHCHRYWLITRTLIERGVEVRHILHTGEIIGSDASDFHAAQPSLF